MFHLLYLLWRRIILMSQYLFLFYIGLISLSIIAASRFVNLSSAIHSHQKKSRSLHSLFLPYSFSYYKYSTPPLLPSDPHICAEPPRPPGDSAPIPPTYCRCSPVECCFSDYLFYSRLCCFSLIIYIHFCK